MSVEFEATHIARTVRMQRLRRLGITRTTRAHLALSRRPRIAAQMGQALGALCSALGQQLGCPVSVKARVVDTAIVPASALARTSAFALVELSAIGAVAAMEVELPFLVTVLERLAGGQPGPVGPAMSLTRIEEAAFAFLCLVAMAELRGRDGLQLIEPRLLTVTTDRGEALKLLEGEQRHVAVDLSLESGDVKGAARLLMPSAALHAALSRVPPCPPGPIAPEVLASGLWCRTLAGRSRLTLDEVRTLSAGDVVLFDDIRLANGRLEGALRLCAPGFVLHGQLDREGFIPNGAQSAFPQEITMIIEPLNEEVAAALPVDVEVELTRLRLSLGDLATLTPGALLPLHINVTEPVLLRVGDRAVARAELVEIDGEVGARILALLP